MSGWHEKTSNAGRGRLGAADIPSREDPPSAAPSAGVADLGVTSSAPQGSPGEQGETSMRPRDTRAPALVPGLDDQQNRWRADDARHLRGMLGRAEYDATNAYDGLKSLAVELRNDGFVDAAWLCEGAASMMKQAEGLLVSAQEKTRP